MNQRNVFFILTIIFVMSRGSLLFAKKNVPSSGAESTKIFYNPQENLNPKPEYVPGDIPLEEVGPARMAYYLKKDELTASVESNAPYLTTLNMGEVGFVAMKNEKAPVAGSFKNFFGVVQLDEKGNFSRMSLVIDINSLDTGIPGRNNRILNIFFRSMKADLGTALIEFDRMDLPGMSLPKIKEAEDVLATVFGHLSLNGQTREISAKINLRKQGTVWKIETQEPLVILISDLGLEKQAYALMKACNHKSLGNAVKVQVKLYLK